MIVELERAAQAFSAMGSEPRLQVLLCLVRAGDAGLLVGDIQSRTGIPASTLNHHLKFMAAAGLIDQEKQGRTIVNRANFDFLAHVGSFITDQCCADASLVGGPSATAFKEKNNV
ncbi:ArsR/SmtB family transcription factor [Maritalea mediterranea]|uniref:Helix-turn-helix domain-containing protein n=1 Tax=Maritalea mediterranea TaxID=2909667 RepID=A0ABS9EE71_9HYPH|nr:metalloregulator ArsR/SmtB family transcription factor [Maritalea mediterranea]MCF4099751.1 helix-turn-helix domain-containing protein [Maritalea mediterranea]